MYCGKCGTANPDGSAFCAACGEKLGSGTGESRKDRKKLAMAAGAALVVLVLLTALFGGISWKAAVKQYVKAYYNGDAKMVVNLIPSAVYKKSAKEIQAYVTAFGMDEKVTAKMIKAEVQDSMQDKVDRQKESLNSAWGDQRKISVNILETENIDRDDLKDLKEVYKEDLGIRISGAKTVSYEMKVRSNGETGSYFGEVYLVKIGGSWYLDYLEYSWSEFDITDIMFGF